MATIRVKRGAAAGLPTLTSGEPGWTTDTNVLYVGTGAGNILIGPGGGYTNEEAQDAVGTILVDSNTVDFAYNDGTPSITADVRTQMSLTSDASGVKLSGDSATPGNSKLYGTDGSGVKGWYDQPATTYTDEEAQDAVGTILTDSATIDFSYNDGTPSITADVKDGSITYAKMQDVSAASRLLGRGGGAGAGDVEEIVLQTNILEMGTSGGLPVLTVNLNGATGMSYTSGGIAIGTVPAANGGTAQTTWTTGDLLYASAANTLAKLAVGAAGTLLSSSGGIPAWTTQAVPTPQGRLTLTTATPVTTADVTAAATLYYTPHAGSLVPLYDGTAWRVWRFTERSLSLAGLTVSLPHDVFLYDSSGTLTLEAVAWTNATTRATAITRQDGVWVKSGSTGRLYLGTFYTTATGQTEDSESRRCVWNAYHRVPRPMKAIDTTDSWNYTTATWRQARASTANQVDYVCGLSEDLVRATVQARMSNSSGTTASAGVGVDSTSANSARLHGAGATGTAQTTTAFYAGYPGIGYHYLAWLEISGAVGTTVWYGDNGLTYWSHGMTAEVMG